MTDNILIILGLLIIVVVGLEVAYQLARGWLRRHSIFRDSPE